MTKGFFFKGNTKLLGNSVLSVILFSSQMLDPSPIGSGLESTVSKESAVVPEGGIHHSVSLGNESEVVLGTAVGIKVCSGPLVQKYALRPVGW